MVLIIGGSHSESEMDKTLSRSLASVSQFVLINSNITVFCVRFPPLLRYNLFTLAAHFDVLNTESHWKAESAACVNTANSNSVHLLLRHLLF